MKILKMIADWRFGGRPDGTRTWDDVPNEEKDWNSWWYLHGKLQDYVGYDKATVTNCVSGGFAKKTINWADISGNKVNELCPERPSTAMCFNGVVLVKIEGIDKPCVGYFWTSNHKKIYWNGTPYDYWMQRGLVCFADDTEACEYANKMMKEKPIIL